MNTATPTDVTALLAHTVRYSGPTLTRYLVGFSDENHTRQMPGLPNHVAWTLGHCAYTMHRLVERFDGPSLPEDAYLSGDGQSGTTEKFDTKAVTLGSVPIDDPSKYPGLERCVMIFDRAVELLASTVESASPELLAREVDWGASAMPLSTLAIRVSLHNAAHSGEIADLRRTLKMPRILG